MADTKEVKKQHTYKRQPSVGKVQEEILELAAKEQADVAEIEAEVTEIREELSAIS